jgi:hypothetical protein
MEERTIAGVEYDSRKAMDFYDAYGEREWTFLEPKSSPPDAAPPKSARHSATVPEPLLLG